MDVASESITHPAVEALQGPLPKPPVQPEYQLGLVLVAIAMVLLPLIYVGLIVTVAFALGVYASVGPAWFDLGSGGGVFSWRALGFIAPIVAGGILLFFMVKPLFAQGGAVMEPVALDRSKQKDLFDFVDKLCGIVGAPRARRIVVDCEANASASFGRGPWDLLAGRLTLTIGLPLVAGLDLRGLAGVLAHEFGHFAQGTGMRFSYVIRSVNNWFARVVYERDAWDERLDAWANQADFQIRIMLHLSRFFVWLTRRVLWFLMMVGHGISCFMLRQMEFDADHYQAKLVGVRAFESTFLRLNSLSIASTQAIEILGRLWEQQELPEDVPVMVVQLADRLPADVEGQAREHLRSGKTGFFDTHPAEAERIVRAGRESPEGTFRFEAPALALFHDFDALSRSATLKYYRDVVGEDAESTPLVPVANVLEETADLEDQMTSLERVFKDTLSIVKLVWLPREIEPIPDWDAACASFRQAKGAMTDRLPAAQTAIETFTEEDERRAKATVACSLLEAEVGIDIEAFGLEEEDPAEARAVIADAALKQAEVAAEVDAFMNSAGEWLGAAIRLLAHPEAAERIEASLVERDVQPLVQAFYCLQDGHDDFLALREPLNVISDLFQAVDEGWGGETAVEKGMWEAARLKTKLETLRERLTEAYPFKHAGGPILIGCQVVGDEIEAPNDIDLLYAQAATAQVRYQQLYLRLLASLTHAAEALEEELDRTGSPSD
jgi:Zn-dependent protease with chaperone function